MKALDVSIAPEGCRERSEGEWSFEMPGPAKAGWTAVERFGPHETSYACTGEAEDFTCTSEHGFDYRPTGLDASVSLEIEYEGRWSAGAAIEGDFDLKFACEGTACSQVAPHWSVTTFPCENSGRFEGAL